MTSYTACKHLTRTKPELVVDQEKAEEISKSYRTMPLFESTLFNNIYTKHYSLLTNEFLRCRWEVFKDGYASREHKPFEFYDKRDEHFYLSNTRIAQAQTTHKRNTFRNKLRAGPGVDFRGQLPIPEELYTMKYHSLARKYPKQYPKEVVEKKK